MRNREKYKEWCRKNADSLREKAKLRYAKRKESGKARAWYLSHREISYRMQRENPDRMHYLADYYKKWLYSDYYIKRKIAKQLGLVDSSFVSEDLIEAKRKQFQVVRLIKENQK